jgi:excinuclease ABC subunit B
VLLFFLIVMTRSLTAAISETNRRRKIQEEFNIAHGITPTSVKKLIAERMSKEESATDKKKHLDLRKIPKEEYATLMKDLERQMHLASANLEFEKAAELRDLIQEVKDKL